MFSLKLFILVSLIELISADSIYQNRNLNNLSQINKAKREAAQVSRKSLSVENLHIYQIMLKHSDEFQFVKEGLKNHQNKRRSVRSGRRKKYKNMMKQRIR